MKYVCKTAVFCIFLVGLAWSIEAAFKLESDFARNFQNLFMHAPAFSPSRAKRHDSESKPKFADVIADARLKRQVQLQEEITKVKLSCAKDMGLSADESSVLLIYTPNPSLKEKCLLACIYRRLGLLTARNKLSAKGVINLSNRLTQSNPIVAALSLVVTEKCNRDIFEKNPCEAAFLINNCIANEFKLYGLDVKY